MAYTVTQEDRDAALELWHTLLAIGPNVETYSDGVKVGKAFQQAFARHRTETLERAADVAKCAFDDRPRLPESFDWHDGFEAGSKAASAAIRALKGMSDE